MVLCYWLAMSIPRLGSYAIAARLLLARQSQRWNRRELASASGVSATAIAHVEDGKGQPRCDTIERLAIALKVSPAWLAFGIGDRELVGRGRESGKQ